MTTNTKPKNHKLIKKIVLRISILRGVRGMSRDKLSELTKIPAKNIHRYETGKQAMTIDELAIIADVLQIGVFHFFL